MSTNKTETPIEGIKEKNWGEIPKDNFGYASDEERRAKRGLEDWELVEKIPQSQKGVPKWFLAVVVAVLLVAVGLSFPFWGDRPGYEREWIDWGFGAAILYIAVFGGFVYLMVNHYSPSVDGIEEPTSTNDSPHNDITNTDSTHEDDKRA
ncbi:MAG: hypothetical protein OEZ68_16790 [Gammaproteobacteria bacterium]|nr:hypothetical protein [Gammaproteobacteria bacterium]MDH5802461.1 hypothetical protein [Gammaproteobacteria bacterium]